jgi:hypothetical protein
MNIFKFKPNTVGGSPTASHFFLLRQRKSNQKEGDPGLPPLRGSLDISPTSGAAQLALAGHTPRAPLRSSNITSDLAEVFIQPSRMASSFISARLNLRLLAKYRGGAQGRRSKIQKHSMGTSCPHYIAASFSLFSFSASRIFK